MTIHDLRELLKRIKWVRSVTVPRLDADTAQDVDSELERVTIPIEEEIAWWEHEHEEQSA